MFQQSVEVANAQLEALATTIGASPFLQLYSGSMPANTAASATGTLLCEAALPSDPFATAASRSMAKSGTWSGTGAAGAGGGTNAGYYRIVDNAKTTCHEQGTVGQSVTVATSASTSANGNVLTFASSGAITGVVAGMAVTGTGVPTGATVAAVSGATVILSHTSTAGVSSAASITFSPDLVLDNPSIASAQTVTITTFVRTNTGHA